MELQSILNAQRKMPIFVIRSKTSVNQDFSDVRQLILMTRFSSKNLRFHHSTLNRRATLNGVQSVISGGILLKCVEVYYIML